MMVVIILILGMFMDQVSMMLITLPLFMPFAAQYGFDTVWLGLKRGQLQRNYVWRFIELCNAGLSLEEIKRQAMEPEETAIDYQI